MCNTEISTNVFIKKRLQFILVPSQWFLIGSTPKNQHIAASLYHKPPQTHVQLKNPIFRNIF